MHLRAGLLLALVLIALATPLAASAETPAPGASHPRHVIYLHGKIVQTEQSARPRHPEFGFYELDKIRQAFQDRGFVVTSEIRPKAASVGESAERVVEQVRRLLASGVPADHVTVVGASMGASIAFLASVRLENPELRFVVLGACLSANVSHLLAEEGKKPSGHLLAIREASDTAGPPCPTWKPDAGSPSTLVAREIVLDTGLDHGFLYRPLPEWVEPAVEWAGGRGEPGR
jgi:pimeloyl-ACP methyl ester carboxylesterase